ncbi:MAG: YbaK/EbsC family protein [Candidatus Limnocylindrales bacterium]|jgi:Ala-tRNA(Pro) deacylase
MSGDQAIPAGPHRGLLDWLEKNGVEYEVHEHPTTFTARETARAEHVNPAAFAKAIGVVTDDGRRALVVLDAADHLDLLKARSVLGASSVRLMTEAELAEACPGCDVGATPAVGAVFGLPMPVDEAIRDVPVLTFHAGSHRYAVRVDRQVWERALGVKYEALAEHRTLEPVWMRS